MIVLVTLSKKMSILIFLYGNEYCGMNYFLSCNTCKLYIKVYIFYFQTLIFPPHL